MRNNATKYTRSQDAVERAIGELRRGKPLLLKAGRQMLLVCAAEYAAKPQITWLQSQTNECRLVITSVRARRLGLTVNHTHPVTLNLQKGQANGWISCAVQGRSDRVLALPPTGKGSKAECAALTLTKLSGLLPAVVAGRIHVSGAALLQKKNDLLLLNIADIPHYQRAFATTLKPVSEAMVPLKGARDTRIIAFRPRVGALEHLAVVIGDIGSQSAPLVRLHSSCITGDVLGSLRCDCGPQLQGAIRHMHAAGGGVILYLNQEGRGIGIVNKLRAYQLQDNGLDTVDANEEMGFNADERQFEIAAQMLHALGVHSIRLLTNNPRKVSELAQFGIKVKERVKLSLPPTKENARYLSTKAKKLGHLF